MIISRMLHLLRKPAVATSAVAAVLLAAVFTYGLFHLNRNGSGATFQPSPSTTVPQAPTNAASGSPAPGVGSSIVSTPPSQRTATARRSKVIEWLIAYAPGGLGGQAVPIIAYAAFARGHCEGLVGVASQLTGQWRTLYESAGAACMAAFRGHPEQWAQAEDDYSRVNSSNPAFECYDHDAYKMLATLINIHNEYPDYRIVRGRSSDSETSCPLITQIIPDHGLAQGGQQVQVRGINLPTTLVVDFGTTSASPAQSNGVEATVTTPPVNSWDSEDLPLRVRVEARDSPPNGPAVYYTYDAPAEPAASTPAKPAASTPAEPTAPSGSP